jgi:hypothetical protein
MVNIAYPAAWYFRNFESKSFVLHPVVRRQQLPLRKAAHAAKTKRRLHEQAHSGYGVASNVSSGVRPAGNDARKPGGAADASRGIGAGGIIGGSFR